MGEFIQAFHVFQMGGEFQFLYIIHMILGKMILNYDQHEIVMNC